MVAAEPILKDRYEIIVIGTGIGGLAAASILAHEGLDVLVLEQADQPGGCCSSFSVADFTFDAAAGILQGFGEVGYHVQRTLFDFLGQQVDLVRRDSAYAMYFGEDRIEFHQDRHAFTAELGALFPQQAGSLLSFIRELEHIYQALLDSGGPPRPSSDEPAFQRGGLFLRHPMSAMRLSKYARTSARRVLEKHCDDPMAAAFFDADSTFTTGYRLADLSAPWAALGILDRHVGGTHHAIGSSQQIPDRLEKSIIESGGHVAYRLGVDRVLVEGGRAVGVEVAGGRRIASDAVISDTSATELFTRLIPPTAPSREATAWAGSLTQVPSVFGIYLGVPAGDLPEGFNPTTLVIDDPERSPEKFISVSVPSLVDPYLVPEGYHSVTIHAVTDAASWPGIAEPSYGTEEYEQKKQDEAAAVLARLAHVMPEVATSPVIWRIASPATFERMIGREKGAIAAPFPAGTLAPASLPSSVTDVKGLFMAGDSTLYGRGVCNAAASGIHSATAAMRYLSLRAPRFGEARESFVLETVPERPQISGAGVVDSLSAVLEARRCLRCTDAPCIEACPGSIDLPNVMRRISYTNFAGAARLLREMNPLGAVCGLVCPAGSLCEGACVRSGMDAAVRIAELEEFTCAVTPGPEGWPEHFRGQRSGRVAVIGSGPAGISCAYYLSLMGFNVEIFEQEVEAGGLPGRSMTDTRLNRQVLERELEGCLMAGIEFRGNAVFGEDIHFDSLLREGFRAVFLASGLQSIKMPSIRGTDLPGVIDALSFLTAARRKVKREFAPSVAVIGESNLAIDTASLAREMGAEQVYLVTRGPVDSEPGSSRIQAAQSAGVTIVPNRKIIDIQGEGRVEALRTHPNTGAPADMEGEEIGPVLEVGTVIVAWEQEMEPTLGGYLASHLERGPDGLVAVDHNMMTSRQGIFAGGDVTSGGGLVIEACAAGRRAALGIAAYLGGSQAKRTQSPEPGPSEGEDGPGGGFFDKDVAS